MSSAQAILDASRALFAEHAYPDVTIRDIAARAGVSPALVMKCGGSKKELFRRTGTIAPPALPDVPHADLGAALVDDLIGRHERGEIEHLVRALNLRITGPEPAEVRARFLAGYVDPLAAVLHGPDAAVRAELVVGALTGLAAVLRMLRTPAAGGALELVRDHYARAIQLLITPRRSMATH